MGLFGELIEASGGRWIRGGLTAGLVGLIALALVNLNWRIVGGLDFAVLWQYRGALAEGLVMTLVLTAAAAACGMFFGTILAVLTQVPLAAARWFAIGYVELFRNTPILVQVLWIHFALPLVSGINTSAIVSGVIAIVLQASAYFGEIVRGGIRAVPAGYGEASDALGIPVYTRWRRVILPPAFRVMIPPFVNMTISFFKASAILTVLQVGELMTVSTRIANAIFKPIEILTLAALIYFLFGYAISQSTHWLERSLARREGR
ncbi:amino acid ABC transporter permease [Nitratireductor sp. StC3]|uniref:amino acid ABC transporter permease n=1 Tax=Nitratireductor sp. StC3 TaxID=2126741 RepID=UPI000D0D971C|nr:amino acid ABC transporter permease [Nitratireductor sp. StC3]PSM20226.1 ABC transporter permease [Nitratireductor sp. StC3]